MSCLNSFWGYVQNHPTKTAKISKILLVPKLFFTSWFDRSTAIAQPHWEKVRTSERSAPHPSGPFVVPPTTTKTSVGPSMFKSSLSHFISRHFLKGQFQPLFFKARPKHCPPGVAVLHVFRDSSVRKISFDHVHLIAPHNLSELGLAAKNTVTFPWVKRWLVMLSRFYDFVHDCMSHILSLLDNICNIIKFLL